MWQRIIASGESRPDWKSEHETYARNPRRAYYRVQAWAPIRITPLAPHDLDAVVYDLSIPDPLAAPVTLEGPERSALLARLRRIEEKLDLLLGAADIDAPRPLSGRDRRFIVFSGGGLALDVEFDFSKGDLWRVELLLPAPYSRVIRAVGEAVEDSVKAVKAAGAQRLALSFRHIQSAERDAIVAYSYDLQRVALRAKNDGAVAR